MRSDAAEPIGAMASPRNGPSVHNGRRIDEIVYVRRSVDEGYCRVTVVTAVMDR